MLVSNFHLSSGVVKASLRIYLQIVFVWTVFQVLKLNSFWDDLSLILVYSESKLDSWLDQFSFFISKFNDQIQGRRQWIGILPNLFPLISQKSHVRTKIYHIFLFCEVYCPLKKFVFYLLGSSIQLKILIKWRNMKNLNSQLRSMHYSPWYLYYYIKQLRIGRIYFLSFPSIFLYPKIPLI
jgi:hypothetical protein